MSKALRELWAALGEIVEPKRRDSTPSTPEAKAIYGGQGLFGLCTDTQVINASISQPGIANWLNWRPSIYRTNDVGIMTFVDRVPGSTYTHPAGPCEDCGENTAFTVCEWSWCFGRYCEQAPTLDVLETGLKLCEQQPTWRLIGNLTDALGNVLPGGERGNPIQTDFEWSMVRNGRSLASDVAQQLWTGTGTGTAPNLDMVGLSLMINTGWQDKSGADCDGADPVVWPFNSNCIGDLYNGYSVCTYIEFMWQHIFYRLMGAGLGLPMEEECAIWAPPDIANALVREWACCEAQSCEPAASGNTVFINAQEVNEEKRRRWQYPGFIFVGTIRLSNNYEIPVYSDIFIPVTKNTTAMQAVGDIYLLVKSVQGTPLLWGEYQNFSQTIDPELIRRYTDYDVTDDGMFFTAWAARNACVSHTTYIKPRLIGHGMPFQGRLTNVCANVPGAFLPVPDDLYGGKSTPSAVTCAEGVPGVS